MQFPFLLGKKYQDGQSNLKMLRMQLLLVWMNCISYLWEELQLEQGLIVQKDFVKSL